MDVKKRIEICMLLEKMYNNREYAEKVGLQDNSYGKLVDDKRYERKAVRTDVNGDSNNMCSICIC